MMKRHGYTPNEHSKRVKALNGVELPFGTKKTVTEIIPEMTCGEFEQYGDYCMVAVIPGDESNAMTNKTVYTVKWDGEEYEVEANFGNMDFPGVGSDSIFSSGSSEYPFRIIYTEFAAYDFPENHIVVASSDLTATSHTFSVSIVDEEITPIPTEYLPNVIFDLDSRTCNVDFDTFVSVLQGGGMFTIIKQYYIDPDDPRYDAERAIPIYFEKSDEMSGYAIYYLNQSGNVGHFVFNEMGAIKVPE